MFYKNAGRFVFGSYERTFRFRFLGSSLCRESTEDKGIEDFQRKNRDYIHFNSGQNPH